MIKQEAKRLVELNRNFRLGPLLLTSATRIASHDNMAVAVVKQVG
jgi:hypothetical protein